MAQRQLGCRTQAYNAAPPCRRSRAGSCSRRKCPAGEIGLFSTRRKAELSPIFCTSGETSCSTRRMAPSLVVILLTMVISPRDLRTRAHSDRSRSASGMRGMTKGSETTSKHSSGNAMSHASMTCDSFTCRSAPSAILLSPLRVSLLRCPYRSPANRRIKR